MLLDQQGALTGRCLYMLFSCCTLHYALFWYFLISRSLHEHLSLAIKFHLSCMQASKKINEIFDKGRFGKEVLKRTFHNTMKPRSLSSTKRENQKVVEFRACPFPCRNPSFPQADFFSQEVVRKVCRNHPPHSVSSNERENQKMLNSVRLRFCVETLRFFLFRAAETHNNFVRWPSPKNAVHHRPRCGKWHSHFTSYCTSHQSWHSNSRKTVPATKMWHSSITTSLLYDAIYVCWRYAALL